MYIRLPACHRSHLRPALTRADPGPSLCLWSARISPTSYQHLQCSRHACSSCTQQLGEKLVRDVDPVIICPIKRHKQPARQPCFELHLGVGEGRIGYLNNHGVGIAQQRNSEAFAPFHRIAQGANSKKMTLASQSDIGSVRRLLIAKKHRNAGDAFAANNADLALTIILVFGHDRGETAFGEIDVFDRLIRGFKYVVHVKLHRLQTGTEQLKILKGQLGKDLIAKWRMTEVLWHRQGKSPSRSPNCKARGDARPRRQ